MSDETFVTEDFDSDVDSIVEQAEEMVNQSHFEGSIEYSTYRSNEESPIDLELTVSGEFAELSGILTLIQTSNYWTLCTFAHSGSRNGVIVGLTYHPDVRGVFQTELY